MSIFRIHFCFLYQIALHLSESCRVFLVLPKVKSCFGVAKEAVADSKLHLSYATFQANKVDAIYLNVVVISYFVLLK